MIARRLVKKLVDCSGSFLKIDDNKQNPTPTTGFSVNTRMRCMNNRFAERRYINTSLHAVTINWSIWLQLSPGVTLLTGVPRFSEKRRRTGLTCNGSDRWTHPACVNLRTIVYCQRKGTPDLFDKLKRLHHLNHPTRFHLVKEIEDEKKEIKDVRQQKDEQ